MTVWLRRQRDAHTPKPEPVHKDGIFVEATPNLDDFATVLATTINPIQETE